MNNWSVQPTVGIAFPVEKPYAMIGIGVGLVTFWSIGFEDPYYGGYEEKYTGWFKDIFIVGNIYIPISKKFSGLIEGKWCRQTLEMEEPYGYNWNVDFSTLSAKIGFAYGL